MDNKYERFILEQRPDGITIFFDKKRVPIYVPLFIFLIILGIFLFITESIDIFGLVVLLILSITFIFIGLHRSKKPLPSWQLTNELLVYSFGDKNYILPLNKIKKIDIETKINKGGFPLLPLMLIGIHGIVFTLDDGQIAYPGFNFDFKKNAEKFTEFLKSNIKGID